MLNAHGVRLLGMCMTTGLQTAGKNELWIVVVGLAWKPDEMQDF